MAMPHSRMYDLSDRPPIPKRSMWTVDDLEQLPEDGNRYEILYGELLVTPLPSSGHQGIAMRLSLLIAPWCRVHTGWTIRSPGGVYVCETIWFEPDIAVYAMPEFPDRPWREMPPPMLVVEVLSPSTRKRDRHRKRPAYLSHGVAEVWTVDQSSRTIERWTSGSEFPETMRETFSWTPDPALPTLMIADAELFGP